MDERKADRKRDASKEFEEGRAARESVEATATAAATNGTVFVDSDVTDLAGLARRAAKNRSANEQASADAVAQTFVGMKLRFQ